MSINIYLADINCNKNEAKQGSKCKSSCSSKASLPNRQKDLCPNGAAYQASSRQIITLPLHLQNSIKKMQNLNFHHLQKSNLQKTFQEGIYLHSPVFGHTETKTAKKKEQKNLEDILYFSIKSMLSKISCLQQQTTP